MRKGGESSEWSSNAMPSSSTVVVAWVVAWVVVVHFWKVFD
jgi:hypothetical protein